MAKKKKNADDCKEQNKLYLATDEMMMTFSATKLNTCVSIRFFGTENINNFHYIAIELWLNDMSTSMDNIIVFLTPYEVML